MTRLHGAHASALVALVTFWSAAGAAANSTDARPPLPPVSPIAPRPLPLEWVQVPLVFPLVGVSRWSACYNQNRGYYRHSGVDIPAPKMTPIVASMTGRLGFKIYSYWIVGEGQWTGWQVLGTHLNDDTPGTNDGRGGRDFMFAPNLRPGDRVVAGQLIGYVGNSTNATGPHLHFELHGPGGVRNPTPSLRTAQRVSRPVSVVGQAGEPPVPGEVRVDGVPRGYHAGQRVLTVQVVSRRWADGRVMAATRPEQVRLSLPAEVLEELGGVAGLAELARDRVLHLYVPHRNTGAAVVRLAASEYRTKPAAPVQIASTAPVVRPADELRTLVAGSSAPADPAGPPRM